MLDPAAATAAGPSSAPKSRPLIAVIGPTATGKSDLAIELAVRLDAEVVNADASQLYRGMDIGTAKVPPARRRGVPHHLLDILDVTQEASLADYQRQALEVVDRPGRPGLILTGGSGLYVQAVVDRWRIPPTDPQVRARLEDELDRLGAAALHTRLTHLDPVAGAQILPGNTRRVVRALEVIELTGGPFTATLPPPGGPHPGADSLPQAGWVLIGLRAPRPVLDRRIADRVDQMWAAGLEQEVRELLAAGLTRGRTAPRALGYAQMIDQLAGTCTPQQAREQTVTATRRLARRQESWFTRDRRIHWLDHDADDLVERALALALAPQPGGGPAGP